MDVGTCRSDIYPDEERTPSDLFQRKHRENAQARFFSLFPSLRYAIWIKWGVHVGKQRGARVVKDIMQEKGHTLSSYSKCCFQQLWMKEKNADKIAPECISVDRIVQTPWVRHWWGILHVGRFCSPFSALLLRSPVTHFLNQQWLMRGAALTRPQVSGQGQDAVIQLFHIL